MLAVILNQLPCCYQSCSLSLLANLVLSYPTYLSIYLSSSLYWVKVAHLELHVEGDGF